jgi:hypothetical protein
MIKLIRGRSEDWRNRRSGWNDGYSGDGRVLIWRVGVRRFDGDRPANFTNGPRRACVGRLWVRACASPQHSPHPRKRTGRASNLIGDGVASASYYPRSPSTR